MFYSSSTGGFYDEKVHGASIPPDSVQISTAEYGSLLKGQGEGMTVVSDEHGHPTLSSPPVDDQAGFSKEELNSKLQLAATQISIIKPAVDGGYAKPEHNQLLADWQRYRYELALVPEQPGWPDSPQWPVEPEKVI